MFCKNCVSQICQNRCDVEQETVIDVMPASQHHEKTFLLEDDLSVSEGNKPVETEGEASGSSCEH